ncbi:MAG: hypothetical protein CK427_02370, partial [Leptospira sp.]
DSGTSIIDAINGQASWNANYGFQGSADLSFNPERLGNWIQGNGAYSDEQVALNRFEERYGDMKPTDKAFQKAAMGLPLSEEESSLIEKAQREAAQRKEKENVLQGGGWHVTRKNDKNKKEATVSITLDKGQKAEFLEKAEKYLVSQIKDFLKNEGKDLHEVKKAVEQYEKNPNAETAARVAEAYEKTAVAIGAGFTPIAGDVIDGFIALKDVYRGDYLSAGISTAAMFTPFLPATVAKKISKAIFETPLGKKIADSSFGKWAIARFGKKADDVGDEAAKAGEGEFSIIDWTGYPDDLPKPSGPFKILDGVEYDNARKAANNANAKIHRNNPDVKGMDIHEIQPVKFNGSPIDPENKIPLKRSEHSKVTSWWNKFQKRFLRN